MNRKSKPRLAILGGGPVGLEAALYAAELGLPFTVYEQGNPAEHVRRWGHIRLFTPFSMNTSPLGLRVLREESPQPSVPGPTALLTARDHVEAYLEPLAQSSRLRERIQTQTQVVRVGRRHLLKHDRPGEAGRAHEPFLLLLRGPQGERFEEADAVFDCTGTYGQPRHMGPGGLPAVGEAESRPHILYHLPDIGGAQKARFANKNTLVVGAGYSAATAVCQLADVAREFLDTWVIWLTRAGRSQPIVRFMNDPVRERDLLAARANSLATRTDGNVEHHPLSTVQVVHSMGADQGFLVEALGDGKAMEWEVDHVIAAVGYRPDRTLYQELQVSESATTGGPAGVAGTVTHDPPLDGSYPLFSRQTLLTGEPNFFILGAKSYGAHSTFFLRTGFDQVRLAFSVLMEDPSLDLYGKR
jgi:thioredoxin reductase